MRGLKKLIIVAFAVLFIIPSIDNNGFSGVFAFEPGIEEIYSEGVFMVHLDTDIAVYKESELEKIYPASTTKIMTALVVLENIENLDELVEVTNNMNHGFGSNPNFTDAAAADIMIGQENLSYLDCLYALMIYSACDVANILAYNVAGTISDFVDMMNAKAAELGCINTNFGNPHGLHQIDNYTCAYDMFLIARYVYEKYPIFRDIISSANYQMPPNSRDPNGVVLTNTNRLLAKDSSYYYEFAKGIKTGSVPYFYNLETTEYEPGNFNLVSIASREGHTYMIVTLGAPYHDVPGDRGFYSYSDHLALYKWAFSSLEYRTIMSANDIVAQLPVVNGIEDRIQLKPVSDFSYLLPSGLDRTAVLRVPKPFNDEVEAPIEKGQILGVIELVLSGETLARIDMVAATDVSMSIESRIMDNVTGIFGEWWFQTGVALVAALTVFVIILRIINSQRAKNRRTGKNIRR
ncbi:MAG: D-alanyl-D-alanine carboxypeptidase [Oscillospiraceae bacterium]|nr:D-alanyl-D-alanine carboxypeptidase [Oscillospiraceae bacterium]